MSSEQTAPIVPEPPVRLGRHAPRSLRDAWMALTGLSAVFLFEMLDNSILNVALPTIGRDLNASTAGLQWVTGAYAVVFGGSMLAFGAIADRYGRRRVMLIGLVLLGLASLATAFVSTTEELIAVRVGMGIAAAMTTPGSMALAFRLFAADDLRVKAMTVISTVGLVGLAIGPTAGGFVLAIAPWQVLLLVNVPIAALAIVGVRLGIPADDPAGLHRDPIDLVGAALGTAAIVLALIAPTLFVDQGIEAWMPWLVTAAAVAAGVFFVVRQRTARHPLLELPLIAHPLVSSGLAFKAAAAIATAGLGYLVTLQLQLDWGWPPALAALGMLPQVVVLLAGGVVITPFVRRVGMERAAWMSASAVVAGLAVYAVLGRLGYGWIAVALVLVAAGIRVVGVVAGTNVLRGLPESRTTIGAALTDTASEVASGVGLAVAGTVLAGLFAGSIATAGWTAQQTAEFREAVTVAGLALTVVAGALVLWGFLRARGGAEAPEAPTAS
ncbi:Major Facilitator Superfamily protein [Leifsonia sp. 98AMF]|uniref:MFS transporter n=1 Tax=unclassified Leifsonia TaxID=2663824 RepID=UPI00087CBF28|nr:Major Facilitator Superfamily protein [Leifsonia sp. 197AMF]SDI75769.1 Major Facilitator Superfamily protein [Leifsonia sp. 466MF]SDK11748.1 Major Facilitator Superfamily protein [Leifsonia sp. 157MF]SDN78986.1 Major Facilitator Superfamily protein [Leifsonia sp. 509MF]SEN28569.1 Major Facilitator Superfamily protein [Leifsonia sp. 467MF]SFL79320.1 Major Facilitator Superfamily protein [Leifsonia sp. 98AMF]